MNKQRMLSLLVMTGAVLTFESCGAQWTAWVKSFFYKKQMGAMSKALAFQVADDYHQRTLGVRSQKEFGPVSSQLINQDGSFSSDARWLSHNNQVLLGHRVNYSDVTTDKIKHGIIATSRKIALPLFITSVVGGVVGAGVSIKPGSGDGAILFGLILTGYGVSIGLGAASLCSGIGFNPVSQRFIKTMNQRVLLRNNDTYYYAYPQLSEVLRNQGVYNLTEEGAAQAQTAMPTEKV